MWDEVRKLIRKARSKVKEILKDEKVEREKFLKERAADHRLAGKIEEAKIIDMIRQQEYNMKCFAHLRRIRGKNRNGELQFITVPDGEMDATQLKWKSIFDQEDMHCLLGERNQQHFSQSEVPSD